MADAQRGIPGEYGSASDMAGGVPPAPPPGPPGSYWGYPPPAHRDKKWTAVGVVVAILIGLAALTVGIVALVTRPAPNVASPLPNEPAAAPSDTTEADRALCSAIAPLMAENDQVSNAYIRLGEAGSPARDQALPQFVSDSEDWVTRMQGILDSHPKVDPYFGRTLQRFLDDRSLLVAGIEAGPLTSYARALWADSLGAYSGPLKVCHDLGITW